MLEVKHGRDSMPRSVCDRVVSAVFSDRFYVTDPDRNCGICVLSTNPTVAEGDVVRVAGAAVESDGEVAIGASSVVVTSSTDAPVPRGMSQKTLGGKNFGVQNGIPNASDLNNIGLLVRCWGKFTYVDSNTFTIDDGSGVNFKCVVSDDIALDPDWDYVAVTGISSCEAIDGELHRLLRAKSVSHITPD